MRPINNAYGAYESQWFHTYQSIVYGEYPTHDLVLQSAFCSHPHINCDLNTIKNKTDFNDVFNVSVVITGSIFALYIISIPSKQDYYMLKKIKSNL
jgi:hypothetical protein